MARVEASGQVTSLLKSALLRLSALEGRVAELELDKLAEDELRDEIRLLRESLEGLLQP